MSGIGVKSTDELRDLGYRAAVHWGDRGCDTTCEGCRVTNPLQSKAQTELERRIPRQHRPRLSQFPRNPLRMSNTAKRVEHKTANTADRNKEKPWYPEGRVFVTPKARLEAELLECVVEALQLVHDEDFPSAHLHETAF